jgi:hypothetical protein
MVRSPQRADGEGDGQRQHDTRSRAMRVLVEANRVREVSGKHSRRFIVLS